MLSIITDNKTGNPFTVMHLYDRNPLCFY